MNWAKGVRRACAARVLAAAAVEEALPGEEAAKWCADVVGAVCDVATPKTNAKVGAPKPSGRYGASGQRVLSDADRDKIRRMGTNAKPFKAKPSKTS